MHSKLHGCYLIEHLIVQKHETNNNSKLGL